MDTQNPITLTQTSNEMEWGALILSMRNKHPKSRLWRMRARQLFAKLESKYGTLEELKHGSHPILQK